MKELERKIAERIEREGPVPFSVFMEMALYDETWGYYRRDVFGRGGDYYTAAQLQPVFGAYVRTLAAALVPGYESFVDMGAGRGEMGEEMKEAVYWRVEAGEEIPKTNRSVLFSNELFDAMPVDLKQDGTLLRVKREGGRFAWHPHSPKEGVREERPGAREMLARAYASLEEGCYIVIDYGYKGREWARFPNGSLMSYRRHVASEEVLRDPGEADITAHVDWDALVADARAAGWIIRSQETLRASIMGLGEDVLEGLNLLGGMQLRTLLFGMGESFEVMLLEKK
ncbi:MAG: SAM-dependent methyltransferase [Bryobacter sp.]|nr:SAM-dependent methyltransferase [Bryobacter sp. CoA8 C33]